MFFQKGTDFIVQTSRKTSVKLLCRLLPFLFVANLVISTSTTLRRFFFLSHNVPLIR